MSFVPLEPTEEAGGWAEGWACGTPARQGHDLLMN